MKLSLIVSTPGNFQGKTIPIARSPFTIGRDPECHLRPASAIVSKHHCALLIRENKAFLQDLGSTNGTFLNDRLIKGEIEVLDGDRLKVGSLLFTVRVQTSVPVSEPTPIPPTKGVRKIIADEEAARVLLSGPADGVSEVPSSDLDRDGVPTGSTTVMSLPAAESSSENPEALPKETAAQQLNSNKKSAGDTASAAKAILEKYIRRPRH